MSLRPIKNWPSYADEHNLQADEAQLRLIDVLDQFWLELTALDKPAQNSWLHKLSSKLSTAINLNLNGGIANDANSCPIPSQGYYIYAEAGRGKTMIMDFFCHCLPDSVPYKRWHFHEFMNYVQRWLAEWRQKAEGKKRSDPLPRFATKIAKNTRLIALDEFFIEDIGDAMILSRLFEALLKKGVYVITTSNLHPDELYKDGLQRQHILPFLDLVKTRLSLFNLQAEHDYRSLHKAATHSYNLVKKSEAKAAMDKLLEQLYFTKGPATALKIAHKRSLTIRKTGKLLPEQLDIARFNFAELCEAPHGSADFMALADHFPLIAIDDIPLIGPEKLSAGKRFITLIDILYEKGNLLICGAAAPAHELCKNKQLSFTFERTASRLIEMQGNEWWQNHVG